MTASHHRTQGKCNCNDNSGWHVDLTDHVSTDGVDNWQQKYVDLKLFVLMHSILDCFIVVSCLILYYFKREPLLANAMFCLGLFGHHLYLFVSSVGVTVPWKVLMKWSECSRVPALRSIEQLERWSIESYWCMMRLRVTPRHITRYWTLDTVSKHYRYTWPL